MAQVNQLPCNGDGICMLCGVKPSAEEQLTCRTCVTPWHAACLASPPPSLAATLHWECPDCAGPVNPPAGAAVVNPADVAAAAGDSDKSGGLVATIRAIEADPSLTERQKAKRRQELLGGPAGSQEEDPRNDVMALFGESFNCAFCMHLLERPVTTPCGHNFCLNCFKKWGRQKKNTCAKCRHPIPSKMASHPRINSTLVAAIRTAKMSKSIVQGGPLKVYHFMHNQNRPDTAFTTERAKKAGKANAASGKIFVTIPRDYFGPITAENDPVRNQGVLVGECWEDRMDCRQWGAHFPHVSGIGGQSKHGAQSVALSGGYQDDEDHGEWFLYTGSGGRDLSGNKRTSKEQTHDQVFTKSNEALRLSCRKGYPVRVVRSHKEKRSSYAPVEGVRYDGIYRVEKCWRKVGKQGKMVCRYLLVRCDNDPAPWTSDEHGDRPRTLPSVSELKHATDITERKGSPSWDYDEEEACWKWKAAPPVSRLRVAAEAPKDRKKRGERIKKTQNMTVRQKLLKEFNCLLCHQVMTLPLTTPCAHNFCKSCLEAKFAGQTFVTERSRGGRTLRARKNVMKCPSCPVDISDFLQNPQVNREMMNVIESLQCKTEENEDASKETSMDEDGDDEDEDEDEDEDDDEDEDEEEDEDEDEEEEEEHDLASGSLSGHTSKEEADSSAVTSEIAEPIVPTSNKIGATKDLRNPPVESKPKRPYKRRKVDTGNNSFKSSPGDDQKMSIEEPEVGKKKKAGGVGRKKPNAGAQTKGKKAQAANGGNRSTVKSP